MAAETSPTTGRRYGIAQVCRVWDVPRSSFYANRRRADTTTSVPARHRGPKPAVSDDALLAAIRADLARSPWHGEGHRDRKSTRLNSSHMSISYAVFCLKK